MKIFGMFLFHLMRSLNTLFVLLYTLILCALGKKKKNLTLYNESTKEKGDPMEIHNLMNVVFYMCNKWNSVKCGESLSNTVSLSTTLTVLFSILPTAVKCKCRLYIEIHMFKPLL